MRTSAISLALACSAVLCVCSERTALAAEPGDLGRVGPVWPVAEPDLLESMRRKAAAKVASGGAAKLERELRSHSEQYLHAPPSLNLPRATQSRSWSLDPAVSMPDDLVDAGGRVLVRAGTRVNPLDYRPLSHELVFADAADAEQIAWLEQKLAASHDAKLVLTGGSPAETAKRLGGRAVYFDQNGDLVRALGIREVPTTVVQEQRHLRLRTFGPEDRP